MPDTGPRVRVNQVGYLPYGPKNATRRHRRPPQPLHWQLRNAAGTAVVERHQPRRAAWTRRPARTCTPSTSPPTPSSGTGYTLVADGETSHPFDISGTVYQQLRSDALQFFYIQRSGIAIDGALVGEQYARPAGHVGVAPEPGRHRRAVPARRLRLPAGRPRRLVRRRRPRQVRGQRRHRHLPAAEQRSSARRPRATADARRGAGRQHAARARARQRGAGHPRRGALGAGVPDAHAGAGRQAAGRAWPTTRCTTRNWTGLPLAPEDDPEQRELHPPSTAATLNLAATAAQCARLFAPYDAALRRPGACSAAPHGLRGGQGQPGHVRAATGRQRRRRVQRRRRQRRVLLGRRRAVPDHRRGGLPGRPDRVARTTPATSSPPPASAGAAPPRSGRLDLATVPNLLPAAERQPDPASRWWTAADELPGHPERPGVRAADAGQRRAATSGAPTATSSTTCIVLATAFDLTGDAGVPRRGGAGDGLHLRPQRAQPVLRHRLGREEPRRTSTAGSSATRLDASLPQPAGRVDRRRRQRRPRRPVRGEPAGRLQADVLLRRRHRVVRHQRGRDQLELGAGLGGLVPGRPGRRRQPPAASTCRVDLHQLRHVAGQGGFTAQVTITNTGTSAIDGWRLRWSFLGGQRIESIWSTVPEQSGATVSARNMSLERSDRARPVGHVRVHRSRPGWRQSRTGPIHAQREPMHLALRRPAVMKTMHGPCTWFMTAGVA